MTDAQREALRLLPKVDVLLQRPSIRSWLERVSRQAVKDEIHTVCQGLRQDILAGKLMHPLSLEAVEAAVVSRLTRQSQTMLQLVINATGTVLHTNLGRALLSQEVARHVAALAASYTNLEYDLETGQRGLRYSHVEGLLKRLTGAEDALVVNNNAAAVLLMLSVLAKGREVLISRGELVEIGGSFRIPDVIANSGASICEVGTTNKTHLYDYEQALCEETGAILKVHQSNYRIIGFTDEVPLQELSTLAHAHGLPCLYDAGSGLLRSLQAYGLPPEITIQDALAMDCDVITISGDKLLGGPQAGIILGKAAYVSRMKRHPLLRALRVDKMTLAALEGTLRCYDNDQAIEKVPTLRMLCLSDGACLVKAQALKELLTPVDGLSSAIVSCRDMVGGGAYPEYTMKGRAVAVEKQGLTADALQERLRHYDLPIISRIHEGWVCLSVRTLMEKDFSIIRDALEWA